MLLTLPPELIFEIFSCLLPGTPSVAFSPSTPGTQDLLNLTLVCKATHDIANQTLIRRCLYITTPRAAGRLANGLLTRFSRESHADGLVLEPTRAVVHIRKPKWEERRAWLRHRPPLAEKGKTYEGRYLNLLRFDSHAKSFDTLFSRVGHCLTRLILSSDFHSRASFEYLSSTLHSSMIRDAFKHLTALEEFCCIEGDANFSCSAHLDDIPIWKYWPKLQRLALVQGYGVSQDFFEGLCSLRQLTHVFLFFPISQSLIHHVSQPAGCGPGTVQKLIVVQMGDESWVPPNLLLGEETFLGRMKDFGMDRSTKTPGRMLAMSIPPSIVPLARRESWFYAEAQRGGLWNLDQASYLRKDLEI